MRCHSDILFQAVTFLDQTPQVVLDHLKDHEKAHHTVTRRNRKKALKHDNFKDEHSLQGKHDKTHGIC
jgi:hypothetical protein